MCGFVTLKEPTFHLKHDVNVEGANALANVSLEAYAAVRSKAVVLLLVQCCCAHCLWGFCVLQYLYSVFYSFAIILERERESWLLYLNRLPDVHVLWLLVFCCSFSQCHMLVCSV